MWHTSRDVSWRQQSESGKQQQKPCAAKEDYYCQTKRYQYEKQEELIVQLIQVPIKISSHQIRTSHWTQNEHKKVVTGRQSCLSRCLGQPLGLLAYHKILWVRDLQKTQILHDTDILRKHLAWAFLIHMTNSTHHANCQNDLFLLVTALSA